MEHIDKRTPKRKLGDIGENIASDYLTKHGFKVIERNYLRKWGEIDIIAQKKGIMRFVEVKSVSCVTLPPVVPHVTSGYRPEENVHPQKLRRLARTIQTYLLEKKIETDWQLDIITVKISEKDRMARIEMIENIII
ncbi:MAG: YraN family protein [Patescibacteria group bacterium]